MHPIAPPRRRSQSRRPLTLTAALAALVAVSLGVAACGGSSTTTTTTQTSANAAATGTTTAAATTGSASTSASGATTAGATTTGTTPAGGSGTGTTTAAPASSRLAAVHSCLAKKGITIPQGSSLANAKLPSGVSRTQLYEDVRSCSAGFFPPGDRGRFAGRGKGFHNPFSSPRFHAALARFAACLRQHGVNVGEPNTSGKGPVFDTKGINTGSPQFKAAAAQCRTALLSGLGPNRAHPGTSTSGTSTTH
jgi:hypothetical protein